MTWLLVAVGAAVGAPMRYLTDRAVQRRFGSSFPLGTLTVNLVACLVLGVVVGSGRHGGASADTYTLVGPGFCGALSTWSTLSAETLRLAETGREVPALVNVIGSVMLGLCAAAVGVAVGAHLFA